MNLKFEPFYEKYIKTIEAFQLAVNTISFEQMTFAPEKGVPHSNEMLSILQRECFEVENNPDTIQKIKEYANTLDKDSLEYKEVSLRLEKITDSENVPSDEYQKYMKLRNDSMMVWHKAKVNNDYESFKPYLKNIVETTLKISLMYPSSSSSFSLSLSSSLSSSSSMTNFLFAFETLIPFDFA